MILIILNGKSKGDKMKPTCDLCDKTDPLIPWKWGMKELTLRPWERLCPKCFYKYYPFNTREIGKNLTSVK